MQVAAAGVLAQSPRSLVHGPKLERDVKAPFDAVFQTLTRPDGFMSLRKSVAEVKPLDESETCFSVKEIFMGAQAEFVISVYPYYDKCLVHHSGKAEYFCVDASISYTVTPIDEGNTRVLMEYSFVMPSLLASFSKNIVAKDRKSQLEAVAQYAESNPTMPVTTPDACCEIPPMNTDRTSSGKKEKKEKKHKDGSSKKSKSKDKEVPSEKETNHLTSSSSASICPPLMSGKSEENIDQPAETDIQ